ncbi:MAG: 50S ribosomal protein L11 methyltransferase [Desulfobacter sp.]|nr:50S ribosomal protein L11 methyltransferase [Desulfobacter sp.]WDP87762.1 MAG: 50S ribosomal protein L11 methyltransferase [Desulfobacter sp.]
MKNPYEHLHIYNFDVIPELTTRVEAHSAYLGTWEEDGTAFLFFSQPADEVIVDLEARNPGACLVEHYEMSCEQWHGDRIEPYQVESLCIAPPWERMARSDMGTGSTEILLDPGVVFGTGRHQTTEDCLTLIHRFFSKGVIGRMVDIGTGTGLLALGAAALGCGQVLACDFNRLAVETCKKNIGLNRFEDRILAFQARGEDMISIPCDLLVANIHYDVMQHIIAHPGFLEKPWFILSGLLNSETRKVVSVLKDLPVQIVERRCPDGIWNTILGKQQ